MDNNNQNLSLPESSLLNSLNLHTTSMLTSTKISEASLIDLQNVDRRKAIIPTPNRPTITSKSNVIDNIDGELIPEQKNVIISGQTIFEDKHDDTINHVVNPSETEEIDDGQHFDTFIIEQFTPFSGKQNVIQWLDATEKKFNQLKISRNLRFEAISLLVEGDAKRRYIKNRKDIRSFDDFYEFLLIHFDTNDLSTTQSNSSQTIIYNTFNPKSSSQNEPTNESKDKSTCISDTTNLTQQAPPFHSTAITDFGATNVIGGSPDNKSTNSTNDYSSILLDQTTNELRKAIVGDLIKNPKIFRGGKDDVKKWIEDIEHLLDVAHIPDSSRLDLISYSLRGDALQWYKNNKHLFTSWKTFIHELQRAFTSSFHEELAFKKLESYTQGENQSVRSFFNEVLKLCKEADSTMSEATKLKNLINKIKPTIQFEVRKKKPTTPAEFLEYARDVEELLQLSEINSDDVKNNNSQTFSEQQSSSSTKVPTSSTKNPHNSSSTKVTSGYSENYNHNRNNNIFTNRNNRNAPHTSSFTPPHLRFTQSNRNQSRINEQQFPSNRNNSSFNSTTNNGRDRYDSSRIHYSNTNKPRPRNANTISPLDSSTNTELEQESLPAISCTQCNQFGHDASSCQNFH